MAKNILDSLYILDEIKSGLRDVFQKSNVDLANDKAMDQFVSNIKERFSNLSLATSPTPDKDVEKLYQNISRDVKDLVNELGLNQNQKNMATAAVAQVTNQTLEAAGFKTDPLAQKIISEHAHKDYYGAVSTLPATSVAQIDKLTTYQNNIHQLRYGQQNKTLDEIAKLNAESQKDLNVSQIKGQNTLDAIAKLNAKLQKDLNLNNRQVNELNIGLGNHLEKTKGVKEYVENNQQFSNDASLNLSEKITKYLDAKTAEKTAEISAKKSQPRVQNAKEALIGARKSVTKTAKTAWKSPSKSAPSGVQSEVKLSTKRAIPQWNKKVAQKSDNNPKMVATDYRNSQEITQKAAVITSLITQKAVVASEQKTSDLNNKEKKSKKNTVSSIVKNIPKMLKNVATNPTKPERDYHNAVTHLEREAIQKAEKLGKEISDKAKTAAALAKEGKNRIKKAVKKKFGQSH